VIDATKLPNFVTEDLYMVHGVENYRQTEPGTFLYMLCAFMTMESQTQGYKEVNIPIQMG